MINCFRHRFPLELQGGLAHKALLSRQNIATLLSLYCVSWCRRYCSHEAQWLQATLLLDEFDGAGWSLIADLVAGEKPATELLVSAFVDVPTEF